MKKTNSAGALLFAIITAFVLSLVASTLVFLTSNQYKMVDSEVDRIHAFGLAQAGVEYAIWWARTHPAELPTILGESKAIPAPADLSNITINIIRIDPAAPAPFQDLSDYGIQVACSY